MPPQSSTSRRKPKDDDAAYVGASGSKRPRDSVDKTIIPDGRRAKRKKVQSATQELATLPPSLVDFTTLSREAVHQYLVHFDIAPVLYPSPISALGPPPPEALLDLQPGQPIKFPSPMVTGAIPADHNAQPQHHQLSNPNRPTLQQQDHSIFSVKNYRSVDDDEDSAGPSSSQRTATLADIADLDVVLARLAERHFRDESVHELDTLATFLALVKNSANGKHPLYLV